MTVPEDPTFLTAAMRLADTFPPPDDLLVRILLNCTNELSIDPSAAGFLAAPEGFDCRPLVGIARVFFSSKKAELREMALLAIAMKSEPATRVTAGVNRDSASASAIATGLLHELLAHAAVAYPPAGLVFVSRASLLFFTKAELILDVLSGGRDPFEAVD